MTRDELFEAYETAIVSVVDPLGSAGSAGGSVDPARACAVRGRSACMITAWNPGFERPGVQANEAANARLRVDLEAGGYEVWEGMGRSPDGTFTEPGFLIWAMPTAAAVAAGRDYGQFAIFEFTANGERFIIEIPAGQ